jgi:phospholipid transport system substrate-binding protein
MSRMKSLTSSALGASGALVLIAAVAPTLAAREDDSTRSDMREVAAVVRDAVEGVVSVLRDDELSRVEKREGVMRIIEPVIDFELLAMLSLGKTHWSRIDDRQRDAFTEVFVETLKLSYFEKLELFSDEVVEFDDPVALDTPGSPKYFVLSSIVSKGDRIKVGYSLTRRKGGWKVYDFDIEGVSIRKSYGSQYDDFLREQSFDELLETMRAKAEEAKAKDAQPASDRE